MFGINHKDREKGQGLVEYALILVLVAIVVVVVMALLGPSIGKIFSQVNAALGGEVAQEDEFDPSQEQDFGSTQWKNGFDTESPVNNYCASEGSGAYYNFYSVDGGSYYVASGYPWTGPNYAFMNTGVCP